MCESTTALCSLKISFRLFNAYGLMGEAVGRSLKVMRQFRHTVPIRVSGMPTCSIHCLPLRSLST